MDLRQYNYYSTNEDRTWIESGLAGKAEVKKKTCPRNKIKQLYLFLSCMQTCKVNDLIVVLRQRNIFKLKQNTLIMWGGGAQKT